MATRADIRIRPYAASDRAAVRRIFQDTAFHGKSHTHFFDDGEWLADVVTAYFTDVEPETCVVAEADSRVIGYITGAKDTARFRKAWATRILPRVVVGFLLRRVWKYRKTWGFLTRGCVSGLKGESYYPASDFQQYPAHLHININANFQNQGVGHKLMEAFLKNLTDAGVRGVHARTAQPAGRSAFFEALGFHVLYSRPLTIGKKSKARP